MYLRNGKVGVFDLGTKELREQELGEENSLRSLDIASSLAKQHGPDPLVLGTGVLTASFVPASCAGLVWAGSIFAPIMGHAGVELKLSGFDFA